MKLDDARQHYYDHSGNLSTVNRQLAFAGIAVVWIFADSDKLPVSVPPELSFPLFCFVIALALDLLHYIALAWAWGIFQHVKEQKHKVDDKTEFLAPNWINTVGVVFWVSKVVLNLCGYVALLRALYLGVGNS